MLSLLFHLFKTFFTIGSVSIGGGYAIIPLIQNEVVNQYGWLTLQEYIDIITISQMTPGPLVVNTASFVGVRVAGVLGAIVATFGSVITGILISIMLYHIFKKYESVASISNILNGLRACSVGLIASAAMAILTLSILGVTSIYEGNYTFNLSALIVFSVSLFLSRKYKLNPMTIMLLSGIAGLILYL